MTEHLSAIEAATAVRRGELSATELVDTAFERIAATNDALNAFVYLDAEGARRSAAEIDRAVVEGRADELGPFAGVPFGVKDLENCAGMPTSRGSVLFLDGPPVDHDTHHVARLRAAGAIPIGKTAAPEFGAIQYTHSDAWGTTRNPWNLDLTPGGSSGGTAAAVSSGMVSLGTASDGGGSIRTPAAWTGLVGLKPSHGRIPSPDADPAQTAVFGALTTTVADSARHLDVASGPHDDDRLSLPPSGVSYEQLIETLDVAGIRVGWTKDMGFAPVEPEVAALTRAAAVATAAAADAQFDEIDVHLTDPVATWLSAGALSAWVAVSDAPDWRERPEDLTELIRDGLESSEHRTIRTLVPSLRRRLRLQQDMSRIFDEVDVLMVPSTAVAAFDAAGPSPAFIDGHEVNPAMSVPFSMLANLCGNPAISVPAGLDSHGRPVGLQIIGRRFADEVPLRLARLLEVAQPWPRTAPGWD